ncbi:MAG: hypothetical protein JXP34_01495 [Planctomycetes bacterium]|nr:hypothetical protein [Planctomycetota bacterium]
MITGGEIAQVLLLAGFASSAPAPPPFPWKAGVEYRFRWKYDGAFVGATRFRFEEAKGSVADGRKIAWRSTATLEYARPGNRLSGTFYTDYDSGWHPLQFRRQFAASVAGFGGGESLVARFGKADVEIVTQQGTQQIKETHALEGPQFLCGSFAMEHWAVFLSRVAHPVPSGHTIPTYQPETGPLPIELSSPSEERIDGVRCTSYSFRSTGFDGRLWIDGEGRLRRYVQGKLEITLVVE